MSVEELLLLKSWPHPVQPLAGVPVQCRSDPKVLSDNPRKFEVIMRNPAAEEQGEAPYGFAGFTVERSEIEKMATRVNAMTLSIRDLASLTKVLLDAGLLYDESEPEEEEAALNRPGGGSEP